MWIGKHLSACHWKEDRMDPEILAPLGQQNSRKTRRNVGEVSFHKVYYQVSTSPIEFISM